LNKKRSAFFERTRERYLALAEHDPSIQTVDANKAMPEVHAAITTVLDTFFESLK